ncbi:astacin-like [Tachypleus tridentatus]|uniref:astacin-like n=1 Tax=Tachypleus tridentatus TaxID=6853 RepID=UPI003FD21B30
MILAAIKRLKLSSYCLSSKANHFVMLALLVVVALVGSNASPVERNIESIGDDSPLYHSHLFEGDIAGVSPNTDRNGIVDDKYLWPGGIIYYEIGESVERIRDDILKGMKEYHQKTCVEFKEKTSDTKDYVKIEWYDGCWSMVGRQGGMQELSLGTGCHWKGLVVHELGHAVGFWHEQNRADRDEYIEIIWDNIWPGMEYNFDKMPYWDTNYLAEEFDYRSVMLYGETAFSKDGASPTVIPKKSGITIGPVWKKPGLSESDVKRVNRLYECFGEKRPPPPHVPDFECNFEEDDCGIVNQEGMSSRFERSYGTLGGRTGYSLKIEVKADGGYAGGRLITPYFKMHGKKKGCLSMDLFMKGDGADKYTILRQNGETKEIYVQEAPKNDDWWEVINLTLDIDDDLRFFFEGLLNGHNGDGVIAIDNVRFQRKDC